MPRLRKQLTPDNLNNQNQNTMKTNQVGYKERVKDGDITAMNALVELELKARPQGEIGLKLLKQTRAYRWLIRRARAQAAK